MTDIAEYMNLVKRSVPVQRYRLIIEGFGCDSGTFDTKDKIKEFFTYLSSKLNMTLLSDPVIWEVECKEDKSKYGFTGYVPWLESGAQLHTWPEYNFITLDIFSCKKFDTTFATSVFIGYFDPVTINVEIPILT